MKITTETGSVYSIDERGVCIKYDSAGRAVDSFKVWYLRVVPDWVTTTKELYELDDEPTKVPEIGKRMYIGGKDTWWISTPVVRIEY